MLLEYSFNSLLDTSCRASKICYHNTILGVDSVNGNVVGARRTGCVDEEQANGQGAGHMFCRLCTPIQFHFCHRPRDRLISHLL